MNSRKVAGDRYPNRVRALEAAIDVLTILNQYNGLSILDIVKATDIPRLRVYRIMASLIEEGYAFKSDSDGRYRLTRDVRELSYGFQQPSWLETRVAPLLAERSILLPWPLSLVAIYKNQLVPLFSTDTSSALLTRRISVGTAIPMLASAAGLVFLAFSEPRRAEILLSIALSEAPSLLRDEAVETSAIRQIVEEARQRGYCVYQGRNYRGLSVPVFRGADLFTALTMRSSADAPWSASEDGLYLPVLKDIALQLQSVLNETSPAAGATRD
jgi:DNA-binding IclR family transcriptional regulator